MLDNFFFRNRGAITTQISADYNKRSENWVAVLACISLGLYPNCLFQVPQESTDRPNGSGLFLESRESAGLVLPQKQKSAYASSESFLRPLSRNSIFVYYLLSRIGGGKGDSKKQSKLRVWDLTRISSMFLLFLSPSKEFDIDYRNSVLTLGPGIRIGVPPRSAVALQAFSAKVRKVLDLGISGNVLNRKQRETVELFLDLLAEDSK